MMQWLLVDRKEADQNRELQILFLLTILQTAMFDAPPREMNGLS